MPIIHVVYGGDFDGECVTYEPLAAFTTLRAAQQLVRQLKRDDAYAYQYAEIRPLTVYRSVNYWRGAQKRKVTT